jgi:imidazoleglycerol-phosphate dehydratase
VREAQAERRTSECSIAVRLELDAGGPPRVATGIRMLDHLLAQLAFAGGIGLNVEARSHDGILHHLAEDVAIAVGGAFDRALEARSGIARFGEAHVAMEDALVRSVVDLAARPYARIALALRTERIEDLDAVLIEHVLRSFATNARLTIHIDALAGRDPHHVAEAAFKSAGRALAAAIAFSTRDGVASTKGVLV